MKPCTFPSPVNYASPLLKSSLSIRRRFPLLLLCLLLGSCASIKRMVLRQTYPTIEKMQTAILAEREEELVRSTLPFTIKLAEGLAAEAPRSPYFYSKLAFLYSAFSFAYQDHSPYDDFDETADEQRAASLRLYKRAFQAGLKSLELSLPGFSTQLFQPQKIDALLQQLAPKHIEALFWTNFSWALLVLYNLSDTSQLFHLATIRKLAERALELSPDYLYGAPYLVLMAYYGARSELLGGDFKKAQLYYQKALIYAENKSLLPDFVYLRFLALEMGDALTFETLYKKIQNFPLEQAPENTYLNALVKRKADALYQKKNLLF